MSDTRDLRPSSVLDTLRGQGAQVTQLSLRGRRGASAHQTTQPQQSFTRPLPEENLGRYPMVGLLGAGGMGAVLHVRDEDLGRDLAAKVIQNEGSGEQLERFILEAQVTGQLEHPNIIPIHELGLTEDRRLYFTMKQVKGRDLAQVLIEADAPGGRQLIPLLEIFLKVCDAVGFAHSRGVIHRDLKPANIMVGEFGEVLLMDWGLAKVIGLPEAGGRRAAPTETTASPGETLDGTVMGTPHYMPPEQAQGRIDALDERADIYALGAILYELLTLEPPFEGDTAGEVLEKVIGGALIPPSERNPRGQIPWELEKVVLKTMARDRDERYASVAELKREITQFLQGGILQAATYSIWQLAAKWARRHRTPLIAAGLAGAAALGLGSWAVTAYQEAGRRRQVAALLDDAKARLASAPLEAERACIKALALAPDSEQVKQQLRQATLAAEARRQAQRSRKQIEAQRRVLTVARQAAAGTPRPAPGVRRDWYRSRLRHLNAARQLHRLQPDDARIGQELIEVSLSLAHQLASDSSWEMADQMIEEAAAAGMAEPAVKAERERLQTRRTARVKQQVRTAREILDSVRDQPPPAGMMEEYVTRLVKLPYPHVVKLLIPALLSKEFRVRRLARRALSGIGDTKTTVQISSRVFPETVPTEAVRLEDLRRGLDEQYREARQRWLGTRPGWRELDAVQVLTLLLGICDLWRAPDEAVQIIWALGRLGDGRAYAVVSLKRLAAGEKSRLWSRTRLPFNWIPDPFRGVAGKTAAEWNQRGFLAMQRGENQRALDAFNAALQMDPRMTIAWNNRGRVRFLMKDYDGALRDYGHALKLDANEYRALLNRGLLYMEQGALKKALADLGALIRLKPDMAEAYNNRGVTWDKMGELDRALADYDKALQINPSYMTALNNRANHRLRRGQFKLSIADLDRAIVLDPSSYAMYTSRAFVKHLNGNWDGALEDATKALEINPRYGRAHRTRALAWEGKRDVARAISELNQALALDDRDAIAYGFRSQMYIRQDKLDKAREDIERALKISPRNASLYRFRAQLFAKQRRYKAALADLDRGVRIAPRNADILIDRAALWQLLNEFGKAIADMERVCKILPPTSPKQRKARRHLANLKILYKMQKLGK